VPESSRIIIGLGNPGKEYAWTRHNFGFLVVGELKERYQISLKNDRALSGLVGKTQAGDSLLYLFMPTTFMNHSGVAVKALLRKIDIGGENILVICDDLNLDYGQLRIRPAGSDGGHNGLSSIIHEIGSKSFARLRGGIGQPAHQRDVVDYVLSNFDATEKKTINNFINKAADCAEVWLKKGVGDTMDQFNKRTNNE